MGDRVRTWRGTRSGQMEHWSWASADIHVMTPSEHKMQGADALLSGLSISRQTSASRNAASSGLNADGDDASKSRKRLRQRTASFGGSSRMVFPYNHQFENPYSQQCTKCVHTEETRPLRGDDTNPRDRSTAARREALRCETMVALSKA